MAVVALLGLLFLGLGVLAPLADIITDRGGLDFPAEYYHARLLLTERASVYDHEAMLALARAEIGRERLPYNVYPPFYSVLFLALVPFPYRVARALWVMLNLAALLLGVLGLRRIWEERAGARLPTGYTLAFFLLAGSLFYPTADHQWQGQANLVELCLVTWAFYFQTRRKSVTPLAALCYAAAVLLKLYPAIFLPYLFVRRQWRLLAWITAFAILFSAASLVIVRPEDYLGYPRLLLESNYVDGAANLANYSLASWAGGLAGFLGLPAAISGPAILLLRLSPYAVFLWLAWRERRPAASQAEALRFAQGFLLIGFIMSQFWEHHLVLLLFPYFMLGAVYFLPAIASATANVTQASGLSSPRRRQSGGLPHKRVFKADVHAARGATAPESVGQVANLSHGRTPQGEGWGMGRFLGLGLTVASAAIVAVPFLGNVRWFERVALIPRLTALGAPTDYLVGFKFVGVLLLLVALELAIRSADR